MKKLAMLFLAAALTLCPLFALAAQETINVYNWGQYISDGTDGYIDINAAFEEAYARNQEEAATLAALQSVDTKELRAQVDALYQQIVLTVNAVAVLQPTDEVTAFIQKVNGIIYKAEQEMGTSTASKPLPDSPGTGEGGGTDTPTDPDAGDGGDDGEGGSPL